MAQFTKKTIKGHEYTENSILHYIYIIRWTLDEKPHSLCVRSSKLAEAIAGTVAKDGYLVKIETHKVLEGEPA